MNEERVAASRRQRLDNINVKSNEDVVKVERQNPLLSIYNYLVVLSIILIVFAAFRNSVTW